MHGRCVRTRTHCCRPEMGVQYPRHVRARPVPVSRSPLQVALGHHDRTPNPALGFGPRRVFRSPSGTERWRSDDDEADRRVEGLEEVSEVVGVGGDKGGGTRL
jgi:hypothetical protein